MILIVDDDPEVRFMMSLWLEELGEPLAEASSGEEALEMCDRERYSVVILDQRMPPGMSGIEVAGELRARSYAAPMVLHSAYLNSEVEAQAASLHLPTVEKGDQAGLIAAIRSAVGGG